MLAAERVGEAAAQRVQLSVEHAPASPFAAGDPRRADPGIVRAVGETLAPMLERRRRVTEAAVERLEAEPDD